MTEIRSTLTLALQAMMTEALSLTRLQCCNDDRLTVLIQIAEQEIPPMLRQL